MNDPGFYFQIYSLIRWNKDPGDSNIRNYTNFRRLNGHTSLLPERMSSVTMTVRTVTMVMSEGAVIQSVFLVLHVTKPI